MKMELDYVGYSFIVEYVLSLLKCMSVESMMPFNLLIPCAPLLLLPSIFSSNRGFPMNIQG